MPYQEIITITYTTKVATIVFFMDFICPEAQDQFR